MSVDPFTGRNPSYCFAEFSDADAANRAMETMQGQDLGGRAIRINPKTERRQGAGERPPRQDRGWGPRDNQQAPRGGNFGYSSSRFANNDQSRGNEPAEEGRRVYVGGLPRIQGQESLEAEIGQLFQDYNLQVVSKLITPHASAFEEDSSNSYCFVDVATPEDAKNAVTMLNGQETPHGGSYKVRHAHSKKREERGGAERSSEGFGGSSRPAYVPRTEPTVTSRVYVGGLPQLEPQDLLDQELRKVFAGFEIDKISNLITPRVRDENEQQNGNFFYCFVDFASPQVAQQAVDAFDGKPSPSGEPLKVRLARERQPQEGGQSGGYQRQRGGFGAGYGNRDTPSKPRDFGGSWRRGN